MKREATAVRKVFEPDLDTGVRRATERVRELRGYAHDAVSLEITVLHEESPKRRTNIVVSVDDITQIPKAHRIRTG